jgi:alpha-beta hydrolase superfamily lysophospholipase
LALPASTSAAACLSSPHIECQAPFTWPQPFSAAADTLPWTLRPMFMPVPSFDTAPDTELIFSPIHAAASVGLNLK